MKIVFNFVFTILCPLTFFGQDFYVQAQNEIKEKDYAQAEVIIKNHLKNNQNDVRAKILLGEIYAYQKEWEKSSEVNKELVESDENNADYHYRYGGTLGLWAKNASKFQALFLLDDVKHHLKRAAELDTNHIDARWALIQLYMELPGIIGGSRKVSEKYANQLLDISPIDAALAKGYIEIYDENYDQAEIHYKNAVELGQSTTTYQKLIDLYHKKNTFKKELITLIEAYQQTHNAEFLQQLLEKDIKTQYLSTRVRNKFQELFKSENPQKDTQLLKKLQLKNASI
ncbi:MAG: tetratricopeptide repeat protein [Psychroflexus halocasei]